jgi:hypothetical protein
MEYERKTERIYNIEQMNYYIVCGCEISKEMPVTLNHRGFVSIGFYADDINYKASKEKWMTRSR